MRKLLLQPVILVACALAVSCNSNNDTGENNVDSNATNNTTNNANNATNNANNASNNGGPTDITNAEFTRRDGSCAAYVGEYTATVTDLGRGTAFESSVTITATDDTCTITSNSIPNHDFNDAGAFATPAAEVDETFQITRDPQPAASTTALSLQVDNAVFLNGAKLDLLAAACYGVGNEPLGQEKIGCFETDTPWRYDPMFSGNAFGTDSHHAHTQPDGAYHYHGDPLAMYDTSGESESGLIGFAADGFPIFGPFIDDGGTIREVTSSYALRNGARESVTGEGAFPGGDYDGTFVDDYEYVADSGDLDECNGMTRDGSYGYYVTRTYPWVLKCFKGTPDDSFRKMP